MEEPNWQEKAQQAEAREAIKTDILAQIHRTCMQVVNNPGEGWDVQQLARWMAGVTEMAREDTMHADRLLQMERLVRGLLQTASSCTSLTYEVQRLYVDNLRKIMEFDFSELG